MTRETVLSATGLSKSFQSGRKRVDVLAGIDLTLHSGELTLLMGPSGSGKSTLLAGLSGLQRPDGGTVVFQGKNIWAGPASALDAFRLTHCGFIFQNVHLVQCLTARQQILFLLGQAGVAADVAGRRADRSLDAVGLSHRAHLMPAELSGGEQQRVAIARTLAMRPKLIFADEPTSSLDSQNGHRIVELLHEAARVQDAMVLCVTHDDRVRDAADRIIHIEDGVLRETPDYHNRRTETA